MILTTHYLNALYNNVVRKIKLYAQVKELKLYTGDKNDLASPEKFLMRLIDVDQ